MAGTLSPHRATGRFGRAIMKLATTNPFSATATKAFTTLWMRFRRNAGKAMPGMATPRSGRFNTTPVGAKPIQQRSDLYAYNRFLRAGDVTIWPYEVLELLEAIIFALTGTFTTATVFIG